MTVVAFDGLVFSQQGESCLSVVVESESRWRERMSLVTSQTIGAAKQPPFELSLMRILVACLAVEVFVAVGFSVAAGAGRHFILPGNGRVKIVVRLVAFFTFQLVLSAAALKGVIDGKMTAGTVLGRKLLHIFKIDVGRWRCLGNNRVWYR